MKIIKQFTKQIENKMYITELHDNGDNKIIMGIVADIVKIAPVLNLEYLQEHYSKFIKNNSGNHQLIVEYDDCIVIVFHGNDDGRIELSTKMVCYEYLTGANKPVYLTCCYSHYYKLYNPELSDYFITDSIHENFICLFENGNFELLNTISVQSVTL